MRQILVVGAGLIGIRHINIIKDHPNCQLAGIVDPDLEKRSSIDAPGFSSISEVDVKVDGVILATPTPLHADQAIEASQRGWHILIEKPVTATLEQSDKLIQALKKTNVQTLVGHHRRYHSSLQKLKSVIVEGKIGKPLIASLIWAVKKPDDYFKGNWRANDGSPVIINLVHDIDNLRFLFGDATDLATLTATPNRSKTRVESGVIALKFASGFTASLAFSDNAPSPWGFEAGTAENPNIAPTHQDMMWISGSRGSISYPSLTLWTGSKDWSQAPSAEQLEVQNTIPLVKQLDHFLDVIEGKSTPIIDAKDARETLAIAMKIEQLMSVN